jgi:hypothetical protein
VKPSKALRSLEDLWLNRPLAAALVGVSPAHFSQSIAPRIGQEHRRTEGKGHLFFAPAVVAAFVAHKLAIEAAKADAEDEALLSGDSPNLERWRAAKADMAEMDVALRWARLIDVDQWRDRTRPMFECLKRFGESLQRTFGREAAIQFNETMDELKTVSARIDEDIDRQRNATPSTNGKYHDERNGT